MSTAEEARRLLAKATPGPWVHVPPGQDGTVHRIEHQVGPGSPRLARMEDTGYSERSSWDQRGRDAELIAAAPTLIADLLTERDALVRWKAEATEVIESWERVYDALGDVGGLGQRRSDAVLAEVLRLKSELDRAQLRAIEASNPGIDMTEVRKYRSRGTCVDCDHKWLQHDHLGCCVIGCVCNEPLAADPDNRNEP